LIKGHTVLHCFVHVDRGPDPKYGLTWINTSTLAVCRVGPNYPEKTIIV